MQQNQLQSHLKQKSNMAKHVPVLLHEAIEELHVTPNAWYVDATFGRGGHTAEILKKGGNVVAFDHDAEAIAFGNVHFKDEISNSKLILIHENFGKLAQTIRQLQKEERVERIAGILFDFGTSSEQLTSAERGFSFEGDGPLDMRMDTRLGVQAKDLLVVLSEKQLEHLFREYGGEEQARAVARAIKQSKTAITTTAQLRKLIEAVKHGKRGRLHPATKVFQALRIAVNSELDEIKDGVEQALEVLHKNGYLVTIAFHEGEDSIAKTILKNAAKHSKITEHTRIKPTETEIASNIRSRSAVLRSTKKL